MIWDNLSLEHHQLALLAQLLIVIALNEPSCTLVPEAFACVCPSRYTSACQFAETGHADRVSIIKAYVVIAAHLPFGC